MDAPAGLNLVETTKKTTEPAVTADPLPFTKDDFTPSKLLALLFPRQKLATREWVSAACHYMLST